MKQIRKYKIRFLLKLVFCFALLLVTMLLPKVSNKVFASTTDNEFCYLSNIPYIESKSSAASGHSICLDKNDNGDLLNLKVDGESKTFIKGICAWATSTIVYDLTDYNYDYFTAYLGVDISEQNNYFNTGVKFYIYTSDSGEDGDWNEILVSKELYGWSDAQSVKVPITGAKFLKLVASSNSTNWWAEWYDEAIYANAKLEKKDYVAVEDKEYTKIHTLEYYDNILSTHNADDNYQDNYRLILEREFVRKFGYKELQLYANLNTDTFDTLEWILSDNERLEQTIEVGEISNPITFMSTLTTLYTNYKEELKTENGYVYQKMMIGLCAAYSTDRVISPLTFSMLKPTYDPLERFALMKKLFDENKFMKMVNGKFVQNDMFKDYHVELMRYVMQDGTRNDEIIWLNEYTHYKNSLSHYMVPYGNMNLNQDKFYDINNKEQYDNKYLLSKYDVPVPFADGRIARYWMLMESQGVCWNQSRFGQSLYRVNGIPAIGCYQVAHEPYIVYSENEKGEGIWTQYYGGNWGGSGTTWGGASRYRFIFDWANKYFTDQNISGPKSATSCGYLILAQANLNQYDAYQKSLYYNLLANSYSTNSDKLTAYNKALDANNINLDTYDNIITIYKSMGDEIKSNDWYNLANRIIDSYTFYPQAMYDLLQVIRPYLEGSERAEIDLKEKEALTRATKTTSEDSIQSKEIITIANALLGKAQPDIVTFSFDGENAGKIVKNSQYTIRYGYSLDGGKTFSKKTTNDSITLTKEEIESITEENDIIINIEGTTKTFKIDITKGTLANDLLYNNDLENRVVGVTLDMEWRMSEDDEWTSYKTSSPDLTGNKTVQVRQSAVGTKLASDASPMYTFTEDNEPSIRKYIPVSHLSVEAYSSQSVDSNRPYYAPNAIDGNINTLWHTDFRYNVLEQETKPFITIKLDEPKYISALEFIQKKYKSNDPDFIKNGIVYVSEDGEKWTEAGRIENCPRNIELRKITFNDSVYGQYVKLEMDTYDMFASIAMINLFEDTTKLENATPTAGIAYSTTEPTNSVVVARLINPSTEITITNNDGKDTYIFTENGEFTFEFEDAKGNKGHAIAVVNWIDKDGPTADIDYELDENKKLSILLDNISEDVYLLDENNNKINYIEANKDKKVSNIYYLDELGDTYKIVNFDEEGNTRKVTYKNTTGLVPSVANYVKTIENGEEVREYFDSNGNRVTITDNEKVLLMALEQLKTSPLEYVFEVSGEYEFKMLDKASNVAHKSIKVDYIHNDTTILASDITYDITTLTNQNVIATINPYVIDEEGKNEKVEIIGNDENNKHTFTENGEFTFKYKDILDTENLEVKEHTAKVDWIDKTPPTAEIRYSTQGTTNQTVVATLANESEEIIVTNNGDSKEYTFTENGEFTFEFQDKAGNRATAKAKVDWITDEKEQEDKITSKKYIIEDNIIYKIAPKTRVSDFMKNVEITTQEVTFTDKDGNILKDTDIITTNTKLQVGKTLHYTLAVIGDIDGNGEIDITDLVKIRRHIQKLDDLKGILRIAGDINEDGNVDITDLVKLRRHIQKIEIIK